ncbi:MAG: plasmid mobilization relaxosome protein MobC [Oscillospiraceae bacterium]|nr:plasmid mobilization relaxosome protein MobC [Oscillospiraceae bacterium]
MKNDFIVRTVGSKILSKPRVRLYSRESYIRTLMDGYIPRPMPPLDYHAMMREFHAIGNNLNQIAQKAHALKVIDSKRYDSAVLQFIKALTNIEEYMLLPEKMKHINGNPNTANEKI